MIKALPETVGLFCFRPCDVRSFHVRLAKYS